MKKVYIAGPMTGIASFNFPAFDDKRDELKAKGYEVVSPVDIDRAHGFDPMGWTEEECSRDSLPEDFMGGAIKRDVDALLKCDCIYMLEGWQKSDGAKAELAIAQWIGLEVLNVQIITDVDEDVLEEALRLTSGDRQNQYGPPDQDFQRTAKMWSALKGVDFTASEVAMFMICIKLSRQTHQKKRDNIVDLAGYARCMSLCKD